MRPGVILLVRNGVEHDARVWRAAGVAAALGDVLVVGAETDSAPAGRFDSSGVTVIRLPATGWLLRWVRRALSGPPEPPSAAVSMTTPAQRHANEGRDALSPRTRLRRIVLGASWTLRATGIVLRRRPAIVHANDWNTMWVGVAAKLIGGCALIYDSHELWADRNGRWEWRPWLVGCEWLFVRYADVVLTTSPGHAVALARRYRVRQPTLVRNLPERLGRPSAAGGPPTLAYGGGIMPGRGLEQALDALALVPGARLRAVGPGTSAYRDSLLQRATTLGVANRFELCPPVPAADVVDELASATVGLCLIQPICRSYELCLPNKLFEYVAAGLPVLCSDLPVMAMVVREHGLGEVVGAEDVTAIAAAIRALLQGDPALEARTVAFANANRWENEAPILARTYADVVGGELSADS